MLRRAVFSVCRVIAYRKSSAFGLSIALAYGRKLFVQSTGIFLEKYLLVKYFGNFKKQNAITRVINRDSQKVYTESTKNGIMLQDDTVKPYEIR